MVPTERKGKNHSPFGPSGSLTRADEISCQQFSRADGRGRRHRLLRLLNPEEM